MPLRTRTERSISSRSASWSIPSRRLRYKQPPRLVRAQPRQYRPMPALELADQIDDQVLAPR
jgi:hypothetical protein